MTKNLLLGASILFLAITLSFTSCSKDEDNKTPTNNIGNTNNTGNTNNNGSTNSTDNTLDKNTAKVDDVDYTYIMKCSTYGNGNAGLNGATADDMAKIYVQIIDMKDGEYDMVPNNPTANQASMYIKHQEGFFYPHSGGKLKVTKNSDGSHSIKTTNLTLTEGLSNVGTKTVNITYHIVCE